MANPPHTPPPGATESVDSDFERLLDDVDDLDDDDCFEMLDELDPLDELDELDELECEGGFSESTSFDDPPPE
jgi:hypothetical protein